MTSVNRFRLSCFLAAYFTLLVPVSQVLVYHAYSPSFIELALLDVLLLAPSLLAVVLMRLSRVLVAIYFSLLVTVVALLLLDLPLLSVVVIFFGLCLLFVYQRLAYFDFVAVFSGCLVLATLVLPAQDRQFGPPAPQADMELPLYLHIVLDAHIGVAGIPLDVGGGALLADELRGMYRDAGLTLHERAYSRYLNTSASMFNLFRLQPTPVDPWAGQQGRSGQVVHLSENVYLNQLVDAGYSLRVLQPTYIDYCAAAPEAVSSCSTIPNLNLAVLGTSDLAAIERVGVLMITLLRQSTLLSDWYNRLAPRWQLPVPATEMLPRAVPSQFDAWIEDVLTYSNGYAHIAHILLPHHPYTLDAQCRYLPHLTPELGKPVGDELEVQQIAGGFRALPVNTEHSRRERYQNYFETLRCTTGLIKRLLAALTQAGIGDARIVIHGDHGPGIYRIPPVALFQKQLRADDIRAAYSVLFATKGGAEDAAGFQAADQLLHQFVSTALQPVPVAVSEDAFVYLLSGLETGGLVKLPVTEFLELKAAEESKP